MSFTRVRRLPVIAGVLTVMALVVPGVAHAAPIDELHVESSDVLVPTGARNAARSVAVRLGNEGDQDVTLANVRVVINATGLQRVVKVAEARPTFDGDCDTDGLITTCTYEKLNVSVIGTPVAFLDLTAIPGAVAGAWGTYGVTVTADGFTRVGEGKATVAEDVDLVAQPEVKLSGDAGSALSLAPSVRNAGSRVVRGAVLSSSSGSRSASYRPQYSNCVYTDVQFFCVFDDQDLAPGKTYAPASPVSILLAEDAPAPSTFETYAEWQTPVDAGDMIASIRAQGGKNGTGPVLRLVEKSAAAQRGAPQTEVTAIDNFTHVLVDVTGKNLPDLAAVGTTVRGETGATVTATIAIRNLGPAVVAWEEFTSAHVKFPAAATVVEADRNCRPVEDKAGEYDCIGFGLTVGESTSWKFKIKINASGTGTITAHVLTDEDGVYAPEVTEVNNTAQLLINPPAGTGGDATGGDGGGEGGGLPVTGVNTTVALIAGVALLLAGAAAVMVARRRRARFVA